MAKVTLVSWTHDPLRVIHAMTQNMAGNIITDFSEIKEEDALATIEQLRKTTLSGPFEFVNFVFQIQAVPRALTHQLVRTRIGSYSQESLRFVAKTGDQFGYDLPLRVHDDPALKAQYMDVMKTISGGYNRLIEMGAATEDARGVLPINVLTNIGVKWDLKTLIGISEVRLCSQSQGHWLSVVRQIKEEISAKVHPALADLLNPYCVNHDGRCGFLSIYDRPCPRRRME